MLLVSRRQSPPVARRWSLRNRRGRQRRVDRGREGTVAGRVVQRQLRRSSRHSEDVQWWDQHERPGGVLHLTTKSSTVGIIEATTQPMCDHAHVTRCVRARPGSRSARIGFHSLRLSMLNLPAADDLDIEPDVTRRVVRQRLRPDSVCLESPCSGVYDARCGEKPLRSSPLRRVPCCGSCRPNPRDSRKPRTRFATARCSGSPYPAAALGGNDIGVTDSGAVERATASHPTDRCVSRRKAAAGKRFHEQHEYTAP